MDGAEFFSPGEAGESYDPAAFERFKQQMQASAAFIAAARKSEQRQKTKEDRLSLILLKFIQSNQKSNVVMLVTRLLEENIPASVILAIILLGNVELQREVDQVTPQLMPGTSVSGEVGSSEPEAASKTGPIFSVAQRIANPSMPLGAKIAIDQWINGIWDTMSVIPFRVLETALDREGQIKKVVTACCANVLADYFESVPEAKGDYDSYLRFCEFFVQGLITNLKKQIENQKELK